MGVGHRRLIGIATVQSIELSSNCRTTAFAITLADRLSINGASKCRGAVSMVPRTLTLLATLHQVVHPVVPEVVGAGIEAFRLGDHLYLLVIVRSSSICSNDSPLKVSMLEVGTRVVDRLALSLPASLARFAGSRAFEHGRANLTNGLSAWGIVSSRCPLLGRVQLPILPGISL